MNKPVWLDNHSTTQMLAEVRWAMEECQRDCWGNSASTHLYGERAQDRVEEARVKVARVINAEPDQIYFTSSATEANNIITKGFYERHKKDYVRITTTNSEHPSILESLKTLDETISQNPIHIQPDGTINLARLPYLLHWDFHKPVKRLISVISANNEIGTIHDLKAIGEICKYHLFHTDATQAIGKVKIDVKEMGIDALTFSGHKIHGPKGVGVLYLKDVDQVIPLTSGGLQNTISSGTQNVPAIVGLGVACENLEDQATLDRIKGLRDELLRLLRVGLPDLTINGTMENRLPNNLNIIIPGVLAEPLVMGLDDVLISSGSACGSGKHEPSYVVKALGVKEPECAIRFGLSRFNVLSEIEYAAQRIIEAAKVLR